MVLCTMCSHDCNITECGIYTIDPIHISGRFLSENKQIYPFGLHHNGELFLICSFKCARRYCYAWKFNLDEDWDDIDESASKRLKLA